MKNIIYRIAISVVIILQTAFMASCSMDDVELSRSVFIPDRTSPGLPEYSEWGYNTFGAYIDRVPFVSGEEEPAKIYVNSDTLHFFLKGIYRNSKDETRKQWFENVSYEYGLSAVDDVRREQPAGSVESKYLG